MRGRADHGLLAPGLPERGVYRRMRVELGLRAQLPVQVERLSVREPSTTPGQETNLRPMMETIRVVKKRRRQGVAGSPKYKMPTRTVPSAPIPVQIA